MVSQEKGAWRGVVGSVKRWEEVFPVGVSACVCICRRTSGG